MAPSERATISGITRQSAVRFLQIFLQILPPKKCSDEGSIRTYRDNQSHGLSPAKFPAQFVQTPAVSEITWNPTDGFTWLAYLSVQAYLVDACVLRDYLAEFYVQFSCPDHSLLVGPPITSMGALKRKVLDKLPGADAITSDLKQSTAEGGWLHVLGAYRDLVVHCAPLARAESRLMAFATELAIAGAESLPAIKLPIPNDPLAASKARASGAHLSQVENELQFFVQANRGDIESTDGLVYSYIARTS